MTVQTCFVYINMRLTNSFRLLAGTVPTKINDEDNLFRSEDVSFTVV